MKNLIMEPGPEIDALIAEKMFGFRFEKEHYEGSGTLFLWKTIWPNGREDIKYHKITKPYSKLIGPAWEVVEKIDSNNHGVKKVEVNYEDYGYHAWFGAYHKDCICYAKTAPHAICLAALKSKGIEIEKAFYHEEA